MRFPPMVLWIVPLLVAASAACGADFTRAEVEFLLAAAPESPRPSFAGRSLAGLDLHALDFHEVDFTSADLSGADLSDADLRGAKLVATKLRARAQHYPRKSGGPLGAPAQDQESQCACCASAGRRRLGLMAQVRRKVGG